MGNENSISSSVYSLNDSLDQIEKRLFRIEDIHMHHQTCYNVDNSVLVSGKKISCSLTCRMIVGPIIGLLGSSSVSILIEIDTTTTISFNVFRSDKFTMEERFVETKSLYVKSSTPTVFVVDELCPETPYTVYIGGIRGEETISSPARFVTLASDGSNLCVNSLNLGVYKTTNAGEYKSVLDAVLQQRKLDFVSNCHQLCLLGSSINLENLVSFHYRNMWESLSAFDGSDRWMLSLSDFEVGVRDAYRQFLCNRTIAELSSSGSFFLIAGSGESGRQVIEFILENLAEAVVVADSNVKSSTITNVKSEKPESAVDQGWAAKRLRKAQQNLPKRPATMIESLSPTVAAEVSGISEFAKLDVSERIELQKLLLYLVASVLRMTYAIYFRQLWDTQFSILQETELKIQFLLKHIITLRAKIWKQVLAIQQLTFNKRKYETKFHCSDFPTEEAIKALQIEIQSAKQNVVSYLQAIAELADNQQSWSDPKFLTLGGGLFTIVFDSEWFWLERCLEMKLPLSKPSSISETAINRMKELLSDKSSGQTTEETNCILCIIPCVVHDPHSDWFGKMSPHVSCSSIQLMEKDFRRLVVELSSWQRRTELRSAIIVCGGDYSANNEVYFHVDHEPLDETGEAFSVEDGIASRDSIRAVIAGRVCLSQNSVFPFLHQRQWSQMRQTALPRHYRIEGKVITVFVPHNVSVPSSNVWSSRFVPRRVNMETPIANSSARFDVVQVSGVPTLSRIKGMVVGRVTDTECSLMVASSEDSIVSLICEDSITGYQYCIRQSVSSSVPAVFKFTNLVPSRFYQVQHVCSLADDAQLGISVASFTTSSNLSTLESSNNADSTGMKVLVLNTSNFLDMSASVEANPYASEASVLLSSIHTSLENLKSLSLLLAMPWNGVDLVVHTQCPMNLGLHLPRVISLIQLADAHEFAGQTELSMGFLNQAQAAMRDGLSSMLFSGATYSRLFKSSAHYIPPLTAVDILRACGYDSLDILNRELTESVVKKLLKLTDSISNEFVSASWLGPEKKFIVHQVHTLSKSVVLFQLQLNWNGGSGRMIDSTQIDLLWRVLKENSFVDTLLVVSPLPIITNDSVTHPLKSCNSHLPLEDTVLILDILFRWTSNDRGRGSKRRVLILSCSNSSSSDIEVTVEYDLCKNSTLPKNQLSSDSNRIDSGCIRQIVCGSPSIRQQSPWTVRFPSREFPDMFFVCESFSDNHLTEMETSSLDQVVSEPFGFVLDVSNSSLDVNLLSGNWTNTAISDSSHFGATARFPDIMSRTTNSLSQIFGFPPFASEVAVETFNLKQYKEAIDSIFESKEFVIERSFRRFANGEICDVLPSEIAAICNGLLLVAHDVLLGFERAIQEFLGFPSLLGVEVAWNVVSKSPDLTSVSESPQSKFAVIRSRFDIFAIFVKVCLLSRVSMDNICREMQLID